jgi:hypothetical protein
VQRGKSSYPSQSRVRLTDEDLCVAYAGKITTTVNREQDLPGIEHCMFLVLYPGDRRSFARVSAPRSWCSNGGDQDVYPILADVFRSCVVNNFKLSEDPRCATLYAFARAFDRRLCEDRFDDRRIQNIIMFGAHPEGWGTMVCLRGTAWALHRMAKELLVDLKDVSC